MLSSLRPAFLCRRTRTDSLRTANGHRTFEINVIGAYIVADEANRIFKQQNLPANIVLTTSANAVVAKKGSLAYDASKAPLIISFASWQLRCRHWCA